MRGVIGVNVWGLVEGAWSIPTMVERSGGKCRNGSEEKKVMVRPGQWAHLGVGLQPGWSQIHGFRQGSQGWRGGNEGQKQSQDRKPGQNPVERERWGKGARDLRRRMGHSAGSEGAAVSGAWGGIGLILRTG